MASLVAVLLNQLCLIYGSLSLATTSALNFTDLSALLAFKSEIKSDLKNVLGSN